MSEQKCGSMVENHLFYIRPTDSLPLVDHAEGIYLYDKDGNRYIDGASGPIACNIGHADPRVQQAMMEQASKVSFAYRAQFLNEPALRLSGKLADLCPGTLDKVFFVSGGSEAIEAAIKVAHQYHRERHEGTRWRVISRKPSYHGLTIGAMSCTAFHASKGAFDVYDLNFPKINAPFCYHCPYDLTPEACGLECLEELERLILLYGPENISAFMAEPIGGVSTGAIVPPDGYYEHAREICDEYGVLLIVDEVMTGFGRTGKFLAIAWWDAVPDIVVLSKGMSAGYTPLGAMVAKREIYDTIMEGSGEFIHGHTYVGNPLSCAIGLKVIEIMEEDGLIENSRKLGEYLGVELRKLKDKHPIFGDVRGRGLFYGVEIVRDQQTKDPFPLASHPSEVLQRIAFGKGLIIYGSHYFSDDFYGDHFMVAPPLIITREEIDALIAILDESAEVFMLTFVDKIQRQGGDR